MRMEPVFSGWCVRYNEECTNGDIFLPGSMTSNHRHIVPLLLNHDPNVVLGTADLICYKGIGVGCKAYMEVGSNAMITLVHELILEQRLKYLSVCVCTDIPITEHQITRGKITEVSICLHDNPRNPNCIITKAMPQ